MTTGDAPRAGGTMRPEDLFVFVGAGASVSSPAGLPAFAAIRRAVVLELGLGAYLNDEHGDGSAPAMALSPEPFMAALSRAGVDVTAWLRSVLGGGEPNAVHVTNVLAKVGDHEAVLRGTRRLPDDAVSTLLILRSASLRIAGSLDEAVDAAEVALSRAADVERHPVRAAHAAFQLALALVWAERVPEAQRCLDERLGPLASIAAVRWRAWADFVEGALAVRGGDAPGAIRALRRCEARFLAEDLADGQISALTALLTAYRLARDFAAYDTTLDALTGFREGGPGTPTWFYARGHRFTEEAILLDRAERARCHAGELDEAETLYRGVAASPYRLHASLAHLGLAMISVERGAGHAEAEDARQRGQAIGARLVVARAEALRRARLRERPGEVFFC